MKTAINPENVLEYERRKYRPWHAGTYMIVTVLLGFILFMMDDTFRRTGHSVDLALPAPASTFEPGPRFTLPSP